MDKKLFSTIAAIFSLSWGSVVLAAEPEGVDFICDNSTSIPVTQLLRDGKTIPVFFWKEQFFSSNKANTLCHSVARKLKTHYQNGHMADGLAITTDWQRGKHLVCIHTATEACPGDSHLFELASSSVLESILPEEAEVIDDGKIVDELQGAFRRTHVRLWWW